MGAVKPLYLGHRRRATSASARHACRRWARWPARNRRASSVLASYDHSNTDQSLRPRRARSRGCAARRRRKARRSRGRVYRRPTSSCRSSPREADVSPETWAAGAAAQSLRRSHEPLILASMYRHLAHAPAFLQRLEAALAPVAGRRLPRSRHRRQSRRRARARQASWRGRSRRAAARWPTRSKPASRPSSITRSARWSHLPAIASHVSLLTDPSAATDLLSGRSSRPADVITRPPACAAAGAPATPPWRLPWS